MDRYTVATTPDGRRVGILDRELYGWCTLVDENKNVLPLEWKTRAGAEAWLNMCYRTWKGWEGGRAAPAGALVPKGWRPKPPDTSPWDRGIQYYS